MVGWFPLTAGGRWLPDTTAFADVAGSPWVYSYHPIQPPATRRFALHASFPQYVWLIYPAVLPACLAVERCTYHTLASPDGDLRIHSCSGGLGSVQNASPLHLLAFTLFSWIDTWDLPISIVLNLRCTAYTRTDRRVYG